MTESKLGPSSKGDDELLGHTEPSDRPSSSSPPVVTGAAELTLRELQVMEFLIEGLSNPEIAVRLGISPRTVSTHVSHILNKLDVKDRTEAVGLWLRCHPL